MAWILIFAGTAILLAILFLSRRRKKAEQHTEQLSYLSLNACMKEAASKCTVRGQTRLCYPRKQTHRFQKAVSRLKALHESEHNPTAKTICENAHLLQSELYPPACSHQFHLPRDISGKARIVLFANAYLLCTKCILNEDTLLSAVKTYSQISPLTEAEIEALPFSIQYELLAMICQLTQAHLSEQQCISAARQAHLLKKYGRLRSAQKLLQRNAGKTAFLAALYALESPASWMGKAFVIPKDDAAQLIDTEKQLQSKRKLLLKNAFLSLETIKSFPWQQVQIQASSLHHFFVHDEIYRRMDEESQAYYRRKASNIAKKCRLSDREVGAAIMELCSKNFGHVLYSHCGYYLLDKGYPDLLSQLHRHTPLRRFQILLHTNRAAYQTALLWFAFLLLLCTGFVLEYAMLMLVPISAVFTATLAILIEKNNRIQQAKRPLPHLQLHQLPQDIPVLIVCYAVLKSPEQVQQVIQQLSIMHDNNPSPQIDFLLLGDFYDCLTLTSTIDSSIVSAASSSVRTLCQTTGRRFFYLQRERISAPGEQTCHGRERSRGAMETILHIIRDREIHDRFAYASFEPAELCGRYRYVALFGENTCCERILPLVGAMQHPLNQRQKINGRFRGASIIRPEIRSDPHTLDTAFGRWLHRSDADPSTKDHIVGLVDPEPFLLSVVQLPDWGILQSAAIDETIAGCIIDSKVCIYRSVQNTLVCELETLHRNVRGLWQLFPLLLPLPGLQVFKHTTAQERARLRRYILQTIIDPVKLLVMLYAALTNHGPLLLLTFLLPAIVDVFPCPPASAMQRLLIKQMILPCTAFVQADSFGRSVYRLLVSHKRLMEWTPALRQNSSVRPRSMLLFGINMSFAGIFAFAAVYQQVWAALFPAAIWALMVFVLPYMEQRTGFTPV